MCLSGTSCLICLPYCLLSETAVIKKYLVHFFGLSVSERAGSLCAISLLTAYTVLTACRVLNICRANEPTVFQGSARAASGVGALQRRL